MTWILKVQYVDEENFSLPLGYTMTLTDELVKDSELDMREIYFKQMLQELDQKIKYENTRRRGV
jgi:hypothetical protein